MSRIRSVVFIGVFGMLNLLMGYLFALTFSGLQYDLISLRAAVVLLLYLVSFWLVILLSWLLPVDPLLKHETRTVIGILMAFTWLATYVVGAVSAAGFGSLWWLGLLGCATIFLGKPALTVLYEKFLLPGKISNLERELGQSIDDHRDLKEHVRNSQLPEIIVGTVILSVGLRKLLIGNPDWVATTSGLGIEMETLLLVVFVVPIVGTIYYHLSRPQREIRSYIKDNRERRDSEDSAGNFGSPNNPPVA